MRNNVTVERLHRAGLLTISDAATQLPDLQELEASQWNTSARGRVHIPVTCSCRQRLTTLIPRTRHMIRGASPSTYRGRERISGLIHRFLKVSGSTPSHPTTPMI